MSDEAQTEQSLLGGLIDALTTHPDKAAVLLHFLSANQFSTAPARAVLAAILALCHRGGPVNLVLLYDYSCEPGPQHGAYSLLYLSELWGARCTLEGAFGLMEWISLREPSGET